MKKIYNCCWCAAETNDEEEGTLILEGEEDALCSECANDLEVQKYLKPVELKRLETNTNPCEEIKMKTYDCAWCTTATNREEKGSFVLKDGEMLCPACYSDPVVQAYALPAEQIPRPKHAHIVIDMQTFDDVLKGLMKKYEGNAIAVKGNHKWIRTFLNMSEHMDL